MINFASIRTHRGSQFNGFEELVVQLARRRPPSDAKEFRRIEGAGGDAGVEGLWLLNDGSEIGIQAKYFLRARDIDWAQVNRSVKVVLQKRPRVKTYRIAFACDLTDRCGTKGKGRTGWAAWDAHTVRWRKQARALGRSVEFEATTASDLVDWIAQPSANGLARYWFGADVLSSEWFAEQVRIASANLGERYTPQQHVVVTASLAFDGLARSRSLKARLRDAVKAAMKHSVVAQHSGFSQAVCAASEKAADALARVYSMDAELDADPSVLWHVEQWVTDLRAAQDELDALEQRLREDAAMQSAKERHTAGHPGDEQRRYFTYRLRETLYALQNLGSLLVSLALRCDTSRVLVLSGEAGTGKSHLLAAEANRSLVEQRPALLFLGQQLVQGDPWDQCARSLGLLTWRRDELFGALDAAGEAHSARTLILVDAINEGAGASLWKHHLSGFLEGLAPYRHIAVVIACRTEYLPHAIPKPLIETCPRAELRGFTTFEEQEAAAIQYLDRRGIVRPAGPMLAPEFSHPLFLKAATDALLIKNEFVFPRGLRGALKILGFYLDSVGRNLLPTSAEPVDLSSELRRALSALAANMATNQRDYVSMPESREIVTEAFKPRVPPAGLTWLDVLLRNGIIRADPDPALLEDDEFEAPRDIVRIAFQRFQDHLVVKAALSGTITADQLFGAGGKLEWLVASDRRYEWVGLFEALSIQIPEAFGIELVDALPGGAEHWWHEWGIQEGFSESVRWRAVRSDSGAATFTDRSFHLLNALGNLDEPALNLLLEVAAVADHPWNAEMLDRNLWRWKLPERDRRWSTVLAFATDDENHAIHRIVTWSTGGRLDTADDETLRLVALVLAWACATTSRPIRDKATKGLRRILTRAPQLYHGLLEKFASVDDPYVLERLLAASYGAACHLGNDVRIAQLASSTFELIFAKGTPPRHLLTRDYALGILQLAKRHGRLMAGINITKAMPPFPDAGRLQAPSKARLEKRKEKIGDHAIFSSCGSYGDFGNYEIAPSVRHFSATRLTDPAPLTRKHKRALFEQQVIKGDTKREKAFAVLEAAASSIWTLEFQGDELSFRYASKRNADAAQKAEQAEAALLLLLSDDQRRRYVVDVRRQLFGLDDRKKDRDPPSFNVEWATRWVTDRAYSLGWTKDLFGEDRTPHHFHRRRNLIERVGKKYQWIALYELLAWISDIYWLKGTWDEFPRAFAFPTDTSFQRDVDPTLPVEADVECHAEHDWWRLGFDFRPLEHSKLATWVASNDPWQDARQAIFREDDAGQKWITLCSYQGVREDHTDREHVAREIGFRREAFLFVHALLVQKKHLATSFAAFRSRKFDEGMRLSATEVVDGPYWGELGWRGTWPNLGWHNDYELPAGILVLKPVAEFVWERHLDASEPNGAVLRVPAPELITGLRLNYPDPRHPRVAENMEGRRIFIDHKAPENGSYATTVRRDAFEQFLHGRDLGCLWFVFGERSAWPDGRAETAPCRWFGRIVSFDGMKVRSFEWERPFGAS